MEREIFLPSHSTQDCLCARSKLEASSGTEGGQFWSSADQKGRTYDLYNWMLSPKGNWNGVVYKYIIEKKGTSKSLFFYIVTSIWLILYMFCIKFVKIVVFGYLDAICHDFFFMLLICELSCCDYKCDILW